MRGAPARPIEQPVHIPPRIQSSQQRMTNRENTEAELMHLIWDAVSIAGQQGYRYQVHVDGFGWVDAPTTWRLVRHPIAVATPRNSYPPAGPSAFIPNINMAPIIAPLERSTDISSGISRPVVQIAPIVARSPVPSIRPLQSEAGSTGESVLPSLNDLMSATIGRIDRAESR